MTREELVRCLGTIAESGTAKFLKAVKVPCIVLLFVKFSMVGSCCVLMLCGL